MVKGGKIMKLSTNFVKDYVDIDVDINQLAEDMTRVGNEYDSACKLINATKLVRLSSVLTIQILTTYIYAR